jgi:hypothetical protein
MLNLFTIKDNKVGITVGDIFNALVNVTFLLLFGWILLLIGYRIVGNRYVKNYCKKVDEWVAVEKKASKDATLRHSLMEKRMIKYYGTSWEKSIYMTMKNQVRIMLLSLLSLNYDLKLSKLTNVQANQRFSEMQYNTYDYKTSGDSPKLAGGFWNHVFQNMGFNWLTHAWNGYDNVKGGEPVYLTASKEGDEKYDEYIANKILNPILGIGGHGKEKTIFDQGADIYDLTKIWMFDNHKAVINDVLNEILIEHPEYKFDNLMLVS